MRHAWMLTVLVAGLTATACGTEPTEALEPTATPTWQQWLGQQIAEARCGSPDHTIEYRNENRTPPYSADFSCTAPTPTWQPTATPWPTATPRATPTPQPPPPTPTPRTAPPTPTMQQMVESDPRTRYAWDQRWGAGGEFEIDNIRQSYDGGWRWLYKCNPPAATEQRRQTAGVSLEELVACGFGIAGLFAGEWTAALACLGLLSD